MDAALKVAEDDRRMAASNADCLGAFSTAIVGAVFAYFLGPLEWPAVAGFAGAVVVVWLCRIAWLAWRDSAPSRTKAPAP